MDFTDTRKVVSTVYKEELTHVLRSFAVGDNGSIIFSNRLANTVSISGLNRE